MKILLADHGQSFSTRARAELIADVPPTEGSFTIDFSGVHQVSGSFVDELLRRCGERPILLGLEAPQVERVVAAVAARRGLTL